MALSQRYGFCAECEEVFLNNEAVVVIATAMVVGDWLIYDTVDVFHEDCVQVVLPPRLLVVPGVDFGEQRRS